MSADRYEDFRRIVEQPEETLDLDLAALAIARAEYPGLDVGLYLGRIDTLAAEAANYLPVDSGGDAHRAIAALNYTLFQKHGYRGNRDQYFEAKNSFLNEVIERRTGIPITLSVLYMEVARRTGLPLAGVGFPGHFLVKYAAGGEDIIIDPFNGGDIKSSDSLRQLLAASYGSRFPWSDRLLDKVTKRQILRRMLNNLKFIYLKQRDFPKGLAALDRMMIADPNQPEDYRDRGIIYYRLEYLPQAKTDLEKYLSLAPEAADAAEVREHLAALAGRSTALH
jgi:regulator of sirC expression with transglutaminase-like and TPR domain